MFSTDSAWPFLVRSEWEPKTAEAFIRSSEVRAAQLNVLLFQLAFSPPVRQPASGQWKKQGGRVPVAIWPLSTPKQTDRQTEAFQLSLTLCPFKDEASEYCLSLSLDLELSPPSCFQHFPRNGARNWTVHMHRRVT